MRSGWMYGILVAVTMAAGGGAVQAKPADAEPVTRVFIHQVGDNASSDAQWRGGMMLGTWSTFVPVEMLPADIRKVGVAAEARLVVDVDDTGAVTDCSEWEKPEPTALAQAACTSLQAHARFAPRRTEPGRAIASRRLFLLTLATRSAGEWAEFDGRSPPAPPPPPGAASTLPRERGWPARRPAYGAISPGPLPSLADSSLSRGKRATTGLLLDVLADGTRHCEVMESAGDAARDAAACVAAEEISWRYDQPCDICYPQRIPILAHWDGRKSRLELPSRAYGMLPRLQGDAVQPGDLGPARPGGLKDVAVLGVMVDAAGRAGTCRVVQSSGDGEIDRRLCAIVSKRGRFSISTDLFGRAVADEAMFSIRFEKLYPNP